MNDMKRDLVELNCKAAQWTHSGLEPMVHGTQTWPPHGPTVGGPNIAKKVTSLTEVTLGDASCSNRSGQQTNRSVA
jgi:hypothetical protein